MNVKEAQMLTSTHLMEPSEYRKNDLANRIKNAAVSGKFSVSIDDLRNNDIRWLTSLGYKLDTYKTKNGYTSNISWE